MRESFHWSARALDRLTPWWVEAKLRAMAALLNHHPAQRHHLRDDHPLAGPVTYRARLGFCTRDGEAAVWVRFGDGRMRVGRGRLEDADAEVRFRTPAQMRSFFGSGADTFHLLLRNEITFTGNLSHILRFGHLAAAVQHKGRLLPPRPGADDPRGALGPQSFPVRPAGMPCPQRPAGEVHRLDDPYLADRTLVDLPRIRRLLWAQRTTPPRVCSERARLWTEFFLRERRAGEAAKPAGLRQAQALRYLLERKRAVLFDDDLLAGTTTSHRVGVQLFPETGALGIWPELLTVQARPLNPYRIAPQDVRILEREVFPFWMDDNIREWARARNGNPLELQLDERFVLYFMWKTQAVSHTIIDLPGVLGRGLLAIQAEARRRGGEQPDPERRSFYRSLEEALDGVLAYANRLKRAALERAADLGPGPQADAMAAMADSLSRVPAHPARTLRDALQATWLLLVCQHQENMNAGLSIGRLDLWLEPYLQADLAGADEPGERRRRVDEALELCCAFLLKCTDHLPLVPDVGNRLFGGSSSDQVITLGGQTSDGRSAVGDMTWLLLKATEMLALRDPNMNARYTPGVNSEAYLRRLCEVNLLTGATPSLHNDAAVVPVLVAHGLSLEHARDWSATGCVEPTSCGRHFGHTNSMMFNLVAPLEMALYQGVHPLLGERIGPATADPRSLGSYPEFAAAYLTQLHWLIDRAVEANNLLGRAHQALKPTPLLSALFIGPMESGRDVIDGGAQYNTSGVALVGLTDVIDSLCAIRTLVFERRAFGFDELLRALAVDFAGHERLLGLLLHSAPKFGQDHPLPGEVADGIQQACWERFGLRPNYRGGRYLTGYWSMSNHVAFGTLSGALPSGRRRGKAFTPGLTPSALAGAALTEQIRAVAALRAERMPNNIAFNVKVVPGAGDDHRLVVDRLAAYAGAYFELGGMQMQFNVVDTATLRRAMEQPDDFRDLIVRISGYNAYFVELNRDNQLELIERAEHALGAR